MILWQKNTERKMVVTLGIDVEIVPIGLQVVTKHLLPNQLQENYVISAKAKKKTIIALLNLKIKILHISSETQFIKGIFIMDALFFCKIIETR